MSRSSLRAPLFRTFDRLQGSPPHGELADTLETLITDNGLDDRRPEWLVDLFASIANDEAFDDRTVPFEQVVNTEYDANNFLAELAERTGLGRINEGEYSVLSFDPLGVSVCVDFQTTDDGVAIRLMRWPVGTGPHFERFPPKDRTP